MDDYVLKFGRIHSRGFKVMRFKLRGVHFAPNFQHPLMAKLCIACEHVLEVLS